jgi:hypothetical protein
VGKIRDAILANCGTGRLTIFDAAAESCGILLEDESFPDFKATYKPEEGGLKGRSMLRCFLSFFLSSSTVFSFLSFFLVFFFFFFVGFILPKCNLSFFTPVIVFLTVKERRRKTSLQR